MGKRALHLATSLYIKFEISSILFNNFYNWSNSRCYITGIYMKSEFYFPNKNLIQTSYNYIIELLKTYDWDSSQWY